MDFESFRHYSAANIDFHPVNTVDKDRPEVPWAEPGIIRTFGRIAEVGVTRGLQYAHTVTPYSTGLSHSG